MKLKNVLSRSKPTTITSVEGQLKIPEKLRIIWFEESEHQQLPFEYHSYNLALGDKSLLKQIIKRLKEKKGRERIKEMVKMEKKCWE